MGSDRKKIIDEILVDLGGYIDRCPESERYAVNQNIVFFEAIKSVPSYITWCFQHAKSIDAHRLLELMDLPFQKWETMLHDDLVALDARSFPGLLNPIKSELFDFIQARNRPFLVDFGCGAMEVERQLLAKLRRHGNVAPVTFVGVDQSKVFKKSIEERFSEFRDIADIHFVDTLTYGKLESFRHNKTNKHQVILAHNDIFALPKMWKPGQVDLFFYIRFRHHLNEDQKRLLDGVFQSLRPTSVYEYDDVNSFHFLFVPLLTSWHNPVLFNAAIFSRLRDPSRLELHAREDWTTRFYKEGMYLSSRDFS